MNLSLPLYLSISLSLSLYIYIYIYITPVIYIHTYEKRGCSTRGRKTISFIVIPRNIIFLV